MTDIGNALKIKYAVDVNLPLQNQKQRKVSKLRRIAMVQPLPQSPKHMLMGVSQLQEQLAKVTKLH